MEKVLDVFKQSILKENKKSSGQLDKSLINQFCNYEGALETTKYVHSYFCLNLFLRTFMILLSMIFHSIFYLHINQKHDGRTCHL